MSMRSSWLLALAAVAACHIPDEHFTPLADAGMTPMPGDFAFEAAELYPTPASIADIAVGDFTSDGHPDIVGVTTTANSTVYLWKSLPGGQFAPPTPVGNGGNMVTAIVTFDVNGDGKLDLITAQNAASMVGVLFGHGDGMFDPVTNSQTPASPTRIAYADLNADQKPDIVVSYSTGWSVQLNNGNGFGAPTTYASPSPRVKGALIADWNGDTRPDFIGFAGDNQENGFGYPFVQQQNGTFASQATATIDGALSFLTNGAAADFDGDGKLDLVASTNNGLSVLKGLGNGTFAAHVIYGPSQTVAQYPVIADWNGDGKLDVITASNSGFVGLFLYVGHGDLTFDAGIPVGSLGDNTQTVLAADMDGDTHLDAVSVSRNGSPIAVVYGTGMRLRAASAFDTTTQLMDLAVADINGDSKQDVVGIAGTIGVYIGNTAGGFSATSVAASGSSLALADISGDGVPDLVATRGSSNGLAVYTNSGGGSFGGATTVDSGEPFTFVAAADLNGDSKNDLVGISTVTGGPIVMLNVGNSNFATPVPYPVGNLDGTSTADVAKALAVVDVTGDSRPDIVIATNTGFAGVLVNNGDGTLAADVGYRITGDSDVFDITGGDVTGDGKGDVVAVTRNGATVYILSNKGDNTFNTPVMLPLLGHDARRIRITDVDKTGIPDLVASCQSGEVDVIVGLGQGNFGHVRAFASGGDSEALVIGDFNGDGRPDVATGTSGLHVLLNRKP